MGGHGRYRVFRRIRTIRITVAGFVEREVEIRICTVAEVERAIDSRSKVWTSLLRGEEKRWSSISDMLTVLRSATNARCGDPKAKVRGIWDQPGAKFEYEIVIQKKS